MKKEEHYIGKLRIICCQTEETEIEIYDTDYFEDDFISNTEGQSSFECIKDLGFEEAFRDDILEIFKEHYALGDSIEIVADAFLHAYSYETYDGREHDMNIWLDNEKHRKLNEYQINLFIKNEWGTDGEM